MKEMKMKPYTALEKSETEYGAYIPDLPGCGVVADTEEEALSLLKEAVQMHVQSLLKDHLQVPEPLSSSALIEIG